jgi:nucleotide-binding universal stress UspA family protein
MSGVVVGVKRSADNACAVRWASAEAAMRGVPLYLVHAWDEPMDLSVNLSPDSLPDLYGNATSCAVHGTAAAVLVGRRAELLVLGGRCREGHRPSRLTRSCVRHAACPVVLVPDAEPPRTGRILAGVCFGETSRRALRWAADEAHRRSARLVVINAWQMHPTCITDVLLPGRAIPAQRGAAHDRLRSWVRGVLGDVAAEVTVTHGGPLDALLDLAHDADLIVLGRCAHTGVSRLLHGALGNDLSSLAPCPVAVVPSQTTGLQPDHRSVGLP